MATRTWTTALQRTPFATRNATLARSRPPNVDRYVRDPLAHLEDGHVLIAGLAQNGVDVELQPFAPYPHEEEIVRAWVDVDHLTRTGLVRFNDLHEEKSRQMGVTWTAAYVLLWALMWHPTAGFALNMDLSLVDDGGSNNTTRSIFGRIRFMADSVLPGGASTWPEHLRPITYLRFRGGNAPDVVNTLTGATVVGRGAVTDPGRSGRYTHALIDEAARLPWAGSVQQALISACPRGRFYNSTPNGKDNIYFRLREERPHGMVFLRHHWSQHPVYGNGSHVAAQEPGSCTRCAQTVAGVPWNPTTLDAHRYPGKLTSPWYDEMVARILLDEDVAQELDISYERSLEARVYPEFQTEVHVWDEIPYAPDVNVELSWDFGYHDTAVGIWQDYNDVLCMIGEYEAHEQTPEDVALGLRRVLRSIGIPDEHLGPTFTSQWFAVGDPSAEQVGQQTGRTFISDYRQQGFTINTQPTTSVERTVVAVKRLLLGRPKPIRISGATCPLMVRHFEQNRWETDRLGRRKPNAKLANDLHNHALRAAAYYVTWKYPPPTLWDDPFPSASLLSDDERLYVKIASYDDVPAAYRDPVDTFGL